MGTKESSSPEKTAAILIIGDEVLSGKVVDANSPYLLKELYRLGVRVRRVVTIPDEVDGIADEVRMASDKFDFVLTSGGIGPTHDDLTFQGIAQAFGVPLYEDPTLKAVLLEHFDGRLTRAALRMTRIPEGTRLIRGGEMRYPLCVVHNVYVFPGVPGILKAKFATVRHEFQGRPFYQIRIYSQEKEAHLAASLEATIEQFKGLTVGSYPTYDNPDFRVMITLESRDRQVTEQARDALLDRMDPAGIVRVEDHSPEPPVNP